MHYYIKYILIYQFCYLKQSLLSFKSIFGAKNTFFCRKSMKIGEKAKNYLIICFYTYCIIISNFYWRINSFISNSHPNSHFCPLKPFFGKNPLFAEIVNIHFLWDSSYCWTRILKFHNEINFDTELFHTHYIHEPEQKQKSVEKINICTRTCKINKLKYTKNNSLWLIDCRKKIHV